MLAIALHWHKESQLGGDAGSGAALGRRVQFAEESVVRSIHPYGAALWRVAAPYLIMSLIWIFASEAVVSQLPPGIRGEAELLKGSAFVLVTTFFVFLLTAHLLKRAAEGYGEAAQAAANRLALYEALPGPVFVLDAEGRVSSWNQRFHDMMGMSLEQIVGQPADFVLAQEDRQPVRDTIARVMANGRPESIEAGLVMPDGRIVPYLWSGAPVLDGRGGSGGIVGFGVDHSGERDRREVLREHLAEIENVLGQTVQAISLAMEVRDPYTSGHQDKVAQLAAAIGRDLGLDHERQKGLELAAAVHDIGKLGVPADLLSLPRRLDSTEMTLVRGHVEWGYRILQGIDFPWPVANIVRQHHERLDGSGYPQGLKQDDILLEARIVAVADVVESMAAHRPYRPALGLDQALAEIDRGSGTIYDPLVVAACHRILEGDFSFVVPKSPLVAQE